MDYSLEKYLLNKSAGARTPIKGTLELTPVCNMHCKMCYIEENYKNVCSRVKAVDYWKSFIPSFKDNGVLFVSLIGGEPFLYPDMESIYCELVKAGFYVSITTNGTLLADEIPYWLMEYKPRYINVSLYGSSNSTYNNLTGNPYGFDQAMKSIENLKDCGIPVNLNYIALPDNICDAEWILNYARTNKLSIVPSFYSYPNISRRGTEVYDRLSPHEAAKVFWLMQKILYEDSYIEKINYYANIDNFGNTNCREPLFGCHGGASSFWIDWEGHMHACGLIDQWKIETNGTNWFINWNKLTNEIVSKKMPERCCRCGYYEICQPCAAKILAEQKCFNGEIDYLCQITKQMVELAKEIIRYTEW